MMPDNPAIGIGLGCSLCWMKIGIVQLTGPIGLSRR